MAELTPCLKPGCPELCETSWCTKHRPKDPRPNSSRRGYDAKWRRTRAAYLAQHPTCVACGNPATEVDHIDGQGPRGPHGHDWANLQPMCKRCHTDKTNTVDGGLGNQRLKR